MHCFVVFSSSNVEVNIMVREMEYFITQALIVFKLENFEDNKGVVRIHKSKKDRQDKRQKKRDKTKNDYRVPSVYRPCFIAKLVYRQKKRDKTTNDYIQNITQKIKHRAIKKNTKTLGFKKKQPKISHFLVNKIQNMFI